MRWPWIFAAALSAALFSTGTALGAHPLITDDAGTQGKGKFQVEFDFEHQYSEGSGVTQRSNTFSAILTGGVSETVDLVFTLPFQDLTTRDSSGKTSASGLGDVGLELKWRFFESGGLSLAVKPGIFMPSGDDEEGLGAGGFGPRIFFIATKQLDPFVLHANVGYIGNQNDIDENRDIWHVSLASEYKLPRGFRLVVNAGAEGSRDKLTDVPEAFILGGVIFSVTENIDLDIGAKGSFKEAADGWSILAGTTFRF